MTTGSRVTTRFAQIQIDQAVPIVFEEADSDGHHRPDAAFGGNKSAIFQGLVQPCRTSRTVSFENRSVDLTDAECRLLQLFARYTGHVLTAWFIAEILGAEIGPAVHRVVRELQRKLESVAPESPLFLTVPRVGYMYIGALNPGTQDS